LVSTSRNISNLDTPDRATIAGTYLACWRGVDRQCCMVSSSSLMIDSYNRDERGGFRCPGEINFCGLPRLERSLTMACLPFEQARIWYRWNGPSLRLKNRSSLRKRARLCSGKSQRGSDSMAATHFGRIVATRYSVCLKHNDCA